MVCQHIVDDREYVPGRSVHRHTEFLSDRQISVVLKDPRALRMEEEEEEEEEEVIRIYEQNGIPERW